MTGPGEKEEPPLFLDSYESDGEQRWCWKNDATQESSQEFDSEDEALEAWRDGRLEFSKLPD